MQIEISKGQPKIDFVFYFEHLLPNTKVHISLVCSDLHDRIFERALVFFSETFFRASVNVPKLQNMYAAHKHHTYENIMKIPVIQLKY